jgi:hypothetical protein
LSRLPATSPVDGPYYLLRAIARAHASGRAIPQFGRSEASFNVVPVDFVVGAAVVAATDPAMVGQTLHLPHDLRPPPFTDYVAPMVEFFRRNEHNPAFAPVS